MNDPNISTMDAYMHDWIRKDPAVPRVTRMWTDPCPKCGAEVTAVHAETQYVIDNPYSVIGQRHPLCQWDVNDPDSPECICGPAIVDPFPDPAYNTRVPVSTLYELRPCRCVVRKVRFYTQEKAVPGTLGELMEMWSTADD